jgi:hypothetical protein
MRYLRRATLAVLIGMFGCGFAYGASHAMPAGNSQQNKMTECNKEAGEKKGDERKAFMSSCLKKEQVKPMTQQEKMTFCNKEAAGKKGDDRKNFMSECLKADKK